MDNTYLSAHYNRVHLRGQAATVPALSHANHGESFYRFLLSVPRLSGQTDLLPVLVPEQLLEETPVEADETYAVAGQLRSFNSRSCEGPRLILSIFARELRREKGPGCNHILLSGTICKSPSFRQTPLGREICDVILAVNRHYGRADYLPCISWGAVARKTAQLEVGDDLGLEGRVQSRIYRKNVEGEVEEHTAYEVSVMRPLPPEELMRQSFSVDGWDAGAYNR